MGGCAPRFEVGPAQYPSTRTPAPSVRRFSHLPAATPSSATPPSQGRTRTRVGTITEVIPASDFAERERALSAQSVTPKLAPNEKTDFSDGYGLFMTQRIIDFVPEVTKHSAACGGEVQCTEMSSKEGAVGATILSTLFPTESNITRGASKRVCPFMCIALPCAGFWRNSVQFGMMEKQGTSPRRLKK